MAKRRKTRIDPAAKFALVFALVFAIAVAILIPVMDRYSARKLQENIAKAEAERQYLLDLSWIDSDLSLTWLAEMDQYEQNAEGEWEYTDSETLLRTYDFAAGSFSDIPVELDGGYGLALVPADDPRGYVLAEKVGDYWSIFRIDENGVPVRLFREKNKDIRDIIGFYGGKLYCDIYTDSDALFPSELSLFSWDSETGETHQYRGSALCISPDGRAVMLIERDTGLFETEYSWYDNEGKPLKEPIETQKPIMGGTLGVEDAQGNWQPLVNTGRDSTFMNIYCAAWVDEDRLLFAARGSQADPYTLYTCTLSQGEISPVTAANGEGICLFGPPLSIGMTVSPDGRYIAYQVEDSTFKYDAPAHLMVQSLETGRCARICPRDDVVDGNKMTSDYPDRSTYHQIWTQ